LYLLRLTDEYKRWDRWSKEHVQSDILICIVCTSTCGLRFSLKNILDVWTQEQYKYCAIIVLNLHDPLLGQQQELFTGSIINHNTFSYK